MLVDRALQQHKGAPDKSSTPPTALLKKSVNGPISLWSAIRPGAHHILAGSGLSGGLHRVLGSWRSLLGPCACFDIHAVIAARRRWGSVVHLTSLRVYERL